MPDSLAAACSARAPISRKEPMSTSAHDPDLKNRMENLLAAGVEAELRLLKSERKAEKRLAEATARLASDEARLLRAQQRLERSHESLAEAEAILRDAQRRRALGPSQGQD